MKSNDWRHKNVARYPTGQHKNFIFFHRLLDGEQFTHQCDSFFFLLFAKQKVTACHTGKKQKHPEDGSGREQKHYKHSHRHIDQCKSADTFHLSFSCTVLLHYTMHSFRKHAKIPFQNIFCPEWDLCSLFCFCLI